MPGPVLGPLPSLLLFGATGKGGSGKGSLYTLTQGAKFTNLVTFNGANGAYPNAGFVLHSDGNLYGSMSGTAGYGSLFKLTQSGSLTKLLEFTGTSGNFPGAQPSGILTSTSGSDGILYGVTQTGGDHNYGQVYQLTSSGSFKVLKSFQGPDGAYPAYAPVLASDGNLYLATPQGGAEFRGTIYGIAPTSGLMGTILDFPDEEGLTPNSGLIQASDGMLYGTSVSDDYTQGAIYRVDLAGNLSTLFSFSSNTGTIPVGGVVEGKDGNFYGVCSTGGNSGFGIVYQVTPAGKMTLLHSFTGGATDGGSPAFPLMKAWDGDIYGVTNSTVFRLRFGPRAVSCSATAISYSSATIYGSVNPSGQKTTVSFEYSSDPDFANPTLLKASATLSGTTKATASADLVNLNSSTTYYFRMKAVNASGTHYTAVSSQSAFTTKAFAEPTNAIEIQADRATLTSKINPRGQSPKVYFRFGTDPYLRGDPASAFITGTETVRTTPISLGSGFKDVAVQKTITKLSPQTYYFYRAETEDPVFGTQLGDTHVLFTKVVGQFNGIVTNASSTGAYSGWISVKLNSSQTMSGVLYFAGVRYSLSGAFSSNGSYTKTISRGTELPALVVKLSTDPTNHQLKGTVTESGISTSQIAAGQQLYDASTAPSPELGLYDTFLYPDPNYTGTSNPTNFGRLKMRVNPAGRVVVSGTLGDGTTIKTSGVLIRGETFPLYAGLYGSTASNYKGSIYGNILFDPANQGCAGPLNWYKAPKPTAKLFPMGFSTVVTAYGSLIGP
jgi:uncharacterized repeat protein (TIGR03803 family)